MAKEELFGLSLIGLAVRACGAFPVRRSGVDRTALRHALEVLKKGEVLGIFPEGKRSSSHQLQEIQPGIAFIAAHSGAPIIPIGISGSEQVRGLGSILHRPSIVVRIGRPFTLQSCDNNQTNRSRLTQANLIRERIAELLPSRYGGSLAFQNDQGNTNEN